MYVSESIIGYARRPSHQVENGTVLDIGRDIRSVPCEVERRTNGFVDTRFGDLSDNLKYWYSIDVLRNLEFDVSYLFLKNSILTSFFATSLIRCDMTSCVPSDRYVLCYLVLPFA